MLKSGGRTAATFTGPDFSVYPGEEVRQSPERAREYFEAIIPEVKRRAEIVFRFSNAEQRQEQVQETLCIAWKDMLRCLRNGKRFTPATLTYYAILHVKSANYHNGPHVQDAMSEATRIRGRSTIEGLTEGLIDRKVKSPAEQVRVKLDYGGFLRSGLLKPKERRVFGLLAKGYRMKEIARRMNVHHCHVWYLKRRIAEKLVCYFGEEFPND
ncbi:hypothetical protein HQ563_03290 [bacterium]|nr:hypothetical protein [bacterium]